jgi:site-specific recombinase XerD
MPPKYLASAKLIWLPENSANSKMTVLPENLAPAKSTAPPENLAPAKMTSPRELRHTFVSIASEAGVPIEEIAALAGHSTTRTTELVYRKELRLVLRTGATVMGELLAAGQ